MEAVNRFSLANSLIRSHAHFRSFKLDASFKAIDDLALACLPAKYTNLSMARMQGSRYLMNTFNFDTHKDESHCFDIDTLKGERLDMQIQNISNCFFDGEYGLLVRYTRPIMIVRDLHEIGEVDVYGKYKDCKNGRPIHGRWSQQIGKTVYVVDKYETLYRIEWQDIKDGIYQAKKLELNNVKHFYADQRLDLATLHTNGRLDLNGDLPIDLRKKIDSNADWTIVNSIAKCWIVSGDLDGQAIMASITNKGDIRSTLRLKLTSNGYEDHNEMAYGGIYALKNAYARHRRGIILAIERDGCCHLISVEDGLMSKLQTIDSIVPQDLVDYERNRVVLSVTATDKAGEFIAGGYHWTKKITIKL